MLPGMTRTLVVRRAAVAALLPLALTSLAGCGGKDEPASAADEPASSASSGTTVTESTPSDSASPTDEATEDGGDAPEAGSPVDNSQFMDIFRSAFDNATTTQMTMTSNGSSSALTAEGVADYTTNPLSMALTMKSPQFGEGTAEIRLVDSVFYIKLPMLGKKFIQFDLNDPSNPFGTLLTDQLDPRSMFDGFERGLKSVTFVGSEDVNGESMDHYQVTVDSAALLQQSGQTTDGMNLPKKITYGMWFDGSGLFRQMRVDLGSTTGGLEVHYDHWGEPVTIQAPPSSEVTTMPGA
jgi:hypothetical protein